MDSNFTELLGFLTPPEGLLEREREVLSLSNSSGIGSKLPGRGQDSLRQLTSQLSELNNV
jgi:hypothetical protein